MALTASILRPKTGGSIQGIRLPTPTSAWQIPDIKTPDFYPRMQYSVTWVITGATSTTTFYQASAATNLPRPGTAGEVENGITLTVVSRVELSKTDNETVWMAKVHYETNPLILPFEIVVQTTHQTRERLFGYRKESPTRYRTRPCGAKSILPTARP